VRRGRVIWSVSLTQTMWLTTPFQARIHVSSLPAERPPRDAIDTARGRWLPKAPSPWLASGGAITEHVPAGLDGHPTPGRRVRSSGPDPEHYCICVVDMSTTQTPSSPPCSEDGLEITAFRGSINRLIDWASWDRFRAQACAPSRSAQDGQQVPHGGGSQSSHPPPLP